MTEKEQLLEEVRDALDLPPAPATGGVIKWENLAAPDASAVVPLNRPGYYQAGGNVTATGGIISIPSSQFKWNPPQLTEDDYDRIAEEVWKRIEKKLNHP